MKTRRQKLHPILRAAFEVLKIEDRPEHRFHRNGPIPHLAMREQRLVADEISRRAKVPALRWTEGDSQAHVAFSCAAFTDEVAKKEYARSKEDAVKFLLMIDELLMTTECRLALLEVAPTETPEIVRVLWRGGPPGKPADRWIVRLEKDHYAWVYRAPRGTKGKGTRTWFQGTRDDAVSCVPEALFESAVKTVLQFDV